MAVAVAVGVAVSVAVAVAVKVAVAVAVKVAVAVAVRVTVAVADFVGVAVLVRVAVAVGVLVAVLVAIAVAVAVLVAVLVAVSVAVGVLVGVLVGVFVGVAAAAIELAASAYRINTPPATKGVKKCRSTLPVGDDLFLPRPKSFLATCAMLSIIEAPARDLAASVPARLDKSPTVASVCSKGAQSCQHLAVDNRQMVIEHTGRVRRSKN